MVACHYHAGLSGGHIPGCQNVGRAVAALHDAHNGFLTGVLDAFKQVDLLAYRDSMQTTVEKEDRVVLRDLQEQIEGEAHFIFSGQVVRGDMFYANPSLKQAQLRVPQLLQLGQERSDVVQAA